MRVGVANPVFIPLPELMKRNIYVDCDELVFRIVSSITYSPKPTSKVPSKALPTTSKYIHEFELTEYTLHKHQDDGYSSPPFYTHPGGYKMRFCKFIAMDGRQAREPTCPLLPF